MGIMKLDHFTVNVTDLGVSEDFYENIVGLEKQELVDMGDHEIRYFALGDTRLELIHYKYDTEKITCDVDSRGIYRHMALLTDDLDGFYKKLTENQVEVTMKPSWCENLKFHNILFKDPNGVEIEVVQR
ncbi:lactoylglutathione lyase [Lachnospiraceae bacterium]|nr:lactoylglutathione lyase [Lachnospiraceae bacterium]